MVSREPTCCAGLCKASWFLQILLCYVQTHLCGDTVQCVKCLSARHSQEGIARSSSTLSGIITSASIVSIIQAYLGSRTMHAALRTSVRPPFTPGMSVNLHCTCIVSEPRAHCKKQFRCSNVEIHWSGPCVPAVTLASLASSERPHGSTVTSHPGPVWVPPCDETVKRGSCKAWVLCFGALWVMRLAIGSNSAYSILLHHTTNDTI